MAETAQIKESDNKQQLEYGNNNKILLIHSILTSIIHTILCALSFHFLHHYAFHAQLYRQYYFPYYANFDGFHFTENFYTHIPNFAFLPGFNLVVQFINKITGPWLLIAVFFLNSLLVWLSALELDKICSILSMNKCQRKICALLFIYNPAAVYYHSVYSQSIFVFLSFKFTSTSLQQVANDAGHINFKRIIKCVLLLIVSNLIRSTALFLLPILGVHILYHFLYHIKIKSFSIAFQWLKYGIFILLSASIVFALYLLWAHHRLCTSFSPPQICHQKYFFNVYSYVQDFYWNVGIFRYYNSQNIVFILIGIPSIVLSIIMLQLPKNIQQFGLQLSFWILLIITVLMTNIQSGTRFISTHPAFYINATLWAIKCSGELKKRKKNLSIRYLIWKFYKAWQIFYFYIGFMLFTLEFPWT